MLNGWLAFVGYWFPDLNYLLSAKFSISTMNTVMVYTVQWQVGDRRISITLTSKLHKWVFFLYAQ